MKQKSLKLNIIMNMLLTMSSFIFPLITFPYVSRILLPEGTGKVSFATSLISYFSMFAQLGIPTYGIRACAKVRDNREELTRTAQELLIINLIMSVVLYIVFFGAILLVPRLHNERNLYVIVSCTIILTSIGMGIKRKTPWCVAFWNIMRAKLKLLKFWDMRVLAKIFLSL